MKLKTILFWIVSIISIIAIAIVILPIGTNLPAFGDSISIYSITKDLLGILFTIIGLKLAFDWKEQTIFVQKNKVAIEQMRSIGEFTRSFDNNFYLLISYFSSINRIANLSLPKEKLLLEYYQKNPNPKFKKRHENNYHRIKMYLELISKCNSDIDSSLQKLVEISNNSFILQEKEYTETINSINKKVYQYFSSILGVPNTSSVDISDFLNIVEFIRNDEIQKIISTQNLASIQQSINDDIIKIRKILYKYL